MAKEYKQVIIVRKDLKVRKGKMMTQAAHASVSALLSRGRLPKSQFSTLKDITHVFGEEVASWISSGQKKITVGVESEQELIEIFDQAKKAGLPCYLVVDSGLTEFGGVPTRTAVGIGPALAEDIDKITGKLSLL